MSQQHQNSHANSPLIDRSGQGWRDFTRVATYVACAIVAVLIVMAIFLT
jgi:hypothetical protein